MKHPREVAQEAAVEGATWPNHCDTVAIAGADGATSIWEPICQKLFKMAAHTPVRMLSPEELEFWQELRLATGWTD